jgi:hypothetical protein
MPFIEFCHIHRLLTHGKLSQSGITYKQSAFKKATTIKMTLRAQQSKAELKGNRERTGACVVVAAL